MRLWNPRLRMRVIAVMVAAVFVLAACSESEPDAGDSGAGGDEELVIGMVTSLTEIATWGGEWMQKGAELAVEQINEDGGIDGHPVRLEIEDGQCDPVTTTSAMEKIVALEPIATVAEFCSSSVLAAVAVAEREQIPNFTVAAGSPDITQDKSYSIRVNPASPQQAEVMAPVLQDEFSPENVFIVYENTDAGVGEKDALSAALGSLGVNVEELGIERELTDYSGVVTRVKNADPDLVTLHMTDGQIIKFAQEAAAQSFAPQFATLFWPSPFLFDEAGDVLDGLVFEQVFHPDATGDKGQEFIDAFETKFDQTPYWVAATTYDAIMMIKEAVESSGSTDPNDINDALHGMEFEGTTGSFTIDDTGQASFGPERLVVVQYSAAAQAIEVLLGGAQ